MEDNVSWIGKYRDFEPDPARLIEGAIDAALVRGGMSPAELGDRLGRRLGLAPFPEQVVRAWKDGRADPPGRTIPLIFKFAGIDLGEHLADAGRRSRPPDGKLEDAVKRRQFLAVASALGMSLNWEGVLGRLSRPLSEGSKSEAITDLDSLNEVLGRESWSVPPRALLPVAEHHYGRARVHVAEAQGSDRRRLLSIASEAATLAGRLSWLCDNRGNASQYFKMAVQLACEADDARCRAHALSQARNLYSQIVDCGVTGKPTMALALLEEAHELLRSAKSDVLLTWVLVLKAEEYALQGRELECRRDLDAADGVFAQAGKLIGFFEHWDEDRQMRFRGGCEILLGNLAEGIRILETIRCRMSKQLLGPWITTTADLASAYAQQGATDCACDLLEEALEIAEPAGFMAGGISQIVGTRQRYITTDLPEVRKLDEHLRLAAAV